MKTVKTLTLLIIAGKEYKDATVTRVETDGILVKYKSGISKLYFTELPEDVQKRAAILVAAVVIGVGLVLLDYVMNGPKSAREMPVISLALQ
jgi:hypothetical protein